MSKKEFITSKLNVSRINPWSAGWNGLLIGLVLGVVFVGFATLTWYTLDSLGVFQKIVNIFTTEGTSGSVKLASWFAFGKVFAIILVIGVSIFLTTPALIFIFALIFNLIAKITDGIELNLKTSIKDNFDDKNSNETLEDDNEHLDESREENETNEKPLKQPEVIITKKGGARIKR